MEIKTDVVIVGTGVGGAFSALNLPEDKQQKQQEDLDDAADAEGWIDVCKETDA